MRSAILAEVDAARSWSDRGNGLGRHGVVVKMVEAEVVFKGLRSCREEAA